MGKSIDRMEWEAKFIYTIKYIYRDYYEYVFLCSLDIISNPIFSIQIVSW